VAFGDAAGEQTREERLEIARRYRERRGDELRTLAAPAVAGEVVAAGEFSTVPTEAIASIPGLGMVLLPIARRRSRKLGLSPKIILALTETTVDALAVEAAGLRRDETEVRPGRSWARAEVRAESGGRAFMRDKVLLHVPDAAEPLTLYAPSLRTSPWSAEVVRLLGGEAPEPIDLGEDEDSRNLSPHDSGNP
jgi:hypothetical protein